MDFETREMSPLTRPGKGTLYSKRINEIRLLFTVDSPLCMQFCGLTDQVISLCFGSLGTEYRVSQNGT